MHVLLLLLIGVAVPMTGSKAIAQFINYPFAQTKAANLARMRAERLNGGLGQYRADRCMYELRGEACLISNTDAGFVFHFQGGAPGWQQQDPQQPKLITEVQVSPDGDTILDVSYNGPLLPEGPNESAPGTQQP